MNKKTYPYDIAYNQIMYDTLISHTNVLKYEGMTYDCLRYDLIQIKKIVDEWLNDVELTIEMTRRHEVNDEEIDIEKEANRF